MNYSQLQDNIYTWVSDETGLTTIWQYSNGPRPVRPYISLLVTSIVQVGTKELTAIDDNGIRSILSQNMMSLSITYHGSESAQNMLGQQVISQVLLSTARQANKLLFQDSGLGYMRSLGQNTLQNQVGTSFEEQSTLDLSFMLVNDITDDVGVIESVELNGKIYDQAGNLKFDDDFTVEDT